MQRSFAYIALSIFVLVTAVPSALAQSGDSAVNTDSAAETPRRRGARRGASRMQLAAGGVLGFGGEAELEYLGNRRQTDVQTTTGFTADFTYPVMRYISVGGEARVLWWTNDADDDAGVGRHLMLEIAPYLKAAYPFGSGDSWGQVYGRLPIGMSMSSLNGDFDTRNGVDSSTGFGWNLGVYGGVEYFFGRFGVRGEMGYQTRAFSNGIDARGRSFDLDVDFGQFMMRAQVVMLL